MRGYEAALTVALLIVSLLAFVAGSIDVATSWARHGSVASGFELALFAAVLITLFYGNLVYQVTRLGRLRRTGDSLAPAGEKALLSETSAPVTVLVPSYKEERRIVLQTLLSAALARHSNKRIVLLLDDPPHANGSELSDLVATRQMVDDLNTRFAAQASRFNLERSKFERRLERAPWHVTSEAEHLAVMYEQAADFVEAEVFQFNADSPSAFHHSDQLFTNAVARPVVSTYRAHALDLRQTPPNREALIADYNSLASAFAVEFTSFERKLYENLCHEPNKAMNLNSYIALMGRSFAQRRSGHRQWLDDCCPEDATLSVPAPKYVLTLDADSIIVPEYIEKLVASMESNPQLAVAQTPYSAFPGASSALERVAGATTDIQYFVHQGFTAFDATFWVGANALLRFEALQDICVVDHRQGRDVRVYVQDKTVIEDTGSTIDLAAKGWTLFNHPERLSYSATPPDFGALVIQRRRWANGGLIIFPDLLRLRAERKSQMSAAELWLRAHYLLSPTLSGMGLLTLLLMPFDEMFWSPWLVLAAVPYYVSYGRDLKEAGYRWADLLRVYAVTLMLIPINLAGVFRSVQQIITGRKSAFGRTPKIEGRTSTPAAHVFILWGIFAVGLISCIGNMLFHRWFYGAFSGANAAAMLYGMTRLVGLRAGWEDLRFGLADLIATVRRRLRETAVPEVEIAEARPR
jgi:cellulose synthase/poly-beta-1,6-N-acetylglucosamine synthase-like glycosyltransferase